MVQVNVLTYGLLHRVCLIGEGTQEGHEKNAAENETDESANGLTSKPGTIWFDSSTYVLHKISKFNYSAIDLVPNSCLYSVA
jgi:hypothetical protein